jgi:hypothetical protein
MNIICSNLRIKFRIKEPENFPYPDKPIIGYSGTRGIFHMPLDDFLGI